MDHSGFSLILHPAAIVPWCSWLISFYFHSFAFVLCVCIFVGVLSCLSYRMCRGGFSILICFSWAQKKLVSLHQPGTRGAEARELWDPVQYLSGRVAPADSRIEISDVVPGFCWIHSPTLEVTSPSIPITTGVLLPSPSTSSLFQHFYVKQIDHIVVSRAPSLDILIIRTAHCPLILHDLVSLRPVWL